MSSPLPPIQVSLQSLREAVAIEPYDTDANLRLSELLAQAGDLGGAREHLARAVSSRTDLWNRLDILQSYFAWEHPHLETLDVSPGVSIPVPIDQPGGRLDLSQLEVFRGHRSGLKYGLEALAPLHHSEGVRLDPALEHTPKCGECQKGRLFIDESANREKDRRRGRRVSIRKNNDVNTAWYAHYFFSWRPQLDQFLLQGL